MNILQELIPCHELGAASGDSEDAWTGHCLDSGSFIPGGALPGV
jgi:hypothetical protein